MSRTRDLTRDLPGGWPVGGSIVKNATGQAGVNRLMQSFPCSQQANLEVPFIAAATAGDAPTYFTPFGLVGVAPAPGRAWRVRSVSLDQCSLTVDGTHVFASLTGALYVNGVLFCLIPLGTKAGNTQLGEGSIWCGQAPTLDGDTAILSGDTLALSLIAQSGPGGTGMFTPVWLPGGVPDFATLISLSGDEVPA